MPCPMSGCWLWIGTVKPSGYGTFSFDAGCVRAHRLAYDALVGQVPLGLDLDHLCRVRSCVNPAHLEPVTRRENLHRGETQIARNAAKTHCDHGHPFDAVNTTFYRHKSAKRLGQIQRRCRQCIKDRDAKRGPRKATTRNV